VFENMNIGGTADSETKASVCAAMTRLNTMLSQHDLTIVGEFATDDTLLLGSDAGELAQGHAELSAFFDELLSSPTTLSWNWHQVSVSALGTLAWLYADGKLVVHDGKGERQVPYRITGVLEKRQEKWLWRQFHGSEPVHSQ